MNKVINTEKLPIKIWGEGIEQGAIDQAKNLANLPFAYKWISIMPDSHQGYGMPIGGVLATEDVIIPNAVGVDIGCGMCVVKSDIKNISKEDIKKIFGGSSKYRAGIRSNIPVGFRWHKKDQGVRVEKDHTDFVTPLLEKSYKQLGTLGGGNHFIEIQEDEEGYVYIMIHSGSRGLGAKIAEYYNKKAQDLNQQFYSQVTKDKELAFLPLNNQLAKDYMKDTEYAIEYAYQNRLLMMQRSMEAMREVFPDVTFGEIINKPHNFARWENHFGKNVIVHRKGATSAREGEIGMIPGSQGTASFIVEGKGNKESFESCSHGSGRVMSRSEARRNLDLSKEKESLDSKDIVHAIRNKNDLDEAPSSYKDIEEVMSHQQDLVRIIKKLTPRGVVKG